MLLLGHMGALLSRLAIDMVAIEFLLPVLSHQVQAADHLIKDFARNPLVEKGCCRDYLIQNHIEIAYSLVKLIVEV